MNLPSAPITVLLVDDHSIMRAGIRLVLESAGMDVIGEAGTGQEALCSIKNSCPDVILLDVCLPDSNGLETLVAIKARCPEAKVLMLTHQENPTSLSRAVAAGAAGYLLKLVTADQLIEAVQAVAQGQVRVDSKLLHQATRQWSTAAKFSTSDQPLFRHGSQPATE